MLNLVNGPRLLFKEAKTLYCANWKAAQERVVNASLRLLEAPILVAEAVCTIALNVLKILHRVSPVAQTLAKAACGLGGAICALETVHETVDLTRSGRFRQQLRLAPKPTWTDLTHLKKTEKIAAIRTLFNETLSKQAIFEDRLPHRQTRRIFKTLNRYRHRSERTFANRHRIIYAQLTKLHHHSENMRLLRTLQPLHAQYLTLSVEQRAEIKQSSKDQRRELKGVYLRENLHNLADRVQLWAAMETDEQLPHLIDVLQQLPSRGLSSRKLEKLTQSQEAARKNAETLIQMIQTQSNKKFVSHSIAFTAIVLTASGVALGLTTVVAPYVPIILIISGAVFALLRSLYVQGVCNTNGWKIKWSNFVPDSLKPATIKRRYALIKSRTRRIGLVALGVITVIATMAIRIFRHPS
jgi:hypothetical protein